MTLLTSERESLCSCRSPVVSGVWVRELSEVVSLAAQSKRLLWSGAAVVWGCTGFVSGMGR